MSTTSFVQYKFCSLCHISCKKFKKHVHSLQHQEIVKNILKKFQKKIIEAKGVLDRPVAKDVIWSEAERKVWCFFCSCDVDLHLPKATVAGNCILSSACFLGHITRKDHSDNTAKFLKDNLVDMKKTKEFALDGDVFLKFLEKAEKIAVDFLNEKDEVLKKAAQAIRLQSNRSRHAFDQGHLEQRLHQQKRKGGRPATPNTRGCLQQTDADYERKKTAQAFGEGLTLIQRLNEDDQQGNIYSNAVPPWLRTDDDVAAAHAEGVIGPSVRDWEKQKKLEQKRKLPTCRVGAKFDHTTAQGEEWLPNFGGVWSQGRRTKAGNHFRKRVNFSNQKPHHLSNATSTKEWSDDTSPLSPSSSSSSSSHPNGTLSWKGVLQNCPPDPALQSRLGWSTPSCQAGSHLQPAPVKQTHPCQIQPWHLNSQVTNHLHSQVTNHRHNVLSQFTHHSHPPCTNSPSTTKSVKPYISKRRKVDPGDQSSAFSLSMNSSSFCGVHLPPAKLNGKEDDCLNESSPFHTATSRIRLISTPILKSKK